MPALGSRVCLLAAAVSLAASDAAAQYSYAPPRDYYRNDTAEGTVTGGAFGAIAGALIGGGKGKTGEGALIGAGVGALTGNLLGRSKDSADQRQAQYGYAAAQSANVQAAAQAVTNYDLAQMTQAGLNEAVIVGAIQQRGARLDLSPQGLIQLKQAGVSDSILVAAQRASGSPASYLAPAQQPPQRTVIVERPLYYYPPPRPGVVFHIGGGRPYHHHGHCW
ncbi:hypothetical protein Pla108_07060 [Botrimarina colliarenosi]|uniref:Glycine zipper domain-containing protein n=1 Tax=Botrimarina colliarenosi TaxID=2528001 RepID=A0A5C6ANL7_9BACT|nr:glycine zipper domain-containing protein [Botrimarina colliarenosi]TWT99763.1 hypothetical protein Pla108_07060 [Botrimarina colliarenosi]